MTTMRILFSRILAEEEGQDLIEYALLAATIALGVTVAMTAVKTALQTEFTAIGTAITAP